MAENKNNPSDTTIAQITSRLFPTKNVLGSMTPLSILIISKFSQHAKFGSVIPKFASILFFAKSSSVRSGAVYIGYGRLRVSGIDGYGWSTRANSSDVRYAYGLGFNASGVVPSYNGNRYYGSPLRCSSIDSNNIWCS